MQAGDNVAFREKGPYISPFAQKENPEQRAADEESSLDQNGREPR
jgi:hypothetical protein